MAKRTKKALTKAEVMKMFKAGEIDFPEGASTVSQYRAWQETGGVEPAPCTCSIGPVHFWKHNQGQWKTTPV